ncbi:response regulator [Bradyrhizobium sp. HKCCYLS1011]|uniref:response regulator n=1 Tax=Bradyrhizobium sp. HKCCYLS1011 TaxID=3420733 RepID=UPI003EBDC7ED
MRQAEDPMQAYCAYKDHRPDVAIMDIALPGASGLEAVRHIRQWDEDAQVLAFSMHAGPAFALKAFEAGTSGYVTKSTKPEDLLSAVRTVAGGGRFLSEDIARAVAADRLAGPRSVVKHLGARETEILRLLAPGMTSSAIADLLNLSQKTVRNNLGRAEPSGASPGRSAARCSSSRNLALVRKDPIYFDTSEPSLPSGTLTSIFQGPSNMRFCAVIISAQMLATIATAQSPSENAVSILNEVCVAPATQPKR